MTTLLPLTLELAVASCRDWADLSGLAPAAHAEQQMERAITRHDYHAARIYTAAHAYLTSTPTTGDAFGNPSQSTGTGRTADTGEPSPGVGTSTTQGARA